jgi:hypothetical protein
MIRECVDQDAMAITQPSVPRSGPLPSSMRSGSMEVLCVCLCACAWFHGIFVEAFRILEGLYPDISQSKFISPIGSVFAFQMCH